jgi:hypothetical protein
MTASYLLLTAAYIVIAGPGIVIAWACFRNLYLAERLLLGSVLGTGIFIYFSYLFKSASLSFIIAYLFIAYSSCIILIIYLKARRGAAAASSLAPSDKPTLLTLTALLIIVYLSRLIPLYFSELPIGWDPTFHLILAKKILLTNTLPVDWQPFESVKLNYPLGSHLLVSALSRLSGQAPPQAFQICFPILSALAAAVIYLLGLSLFNDRKLGLAAAFAYSFLANWGSLDNYRWGGVPNMLGMLFLMSSLWAMTGLNNPYTYIFGAIFLAGVYLAHHHSMATTFLILGAFILGGLITMVSSKRKHPDEFTKRLLLSLLISFLLTLFYLPGYILGVLKTKGQTAVFIFLEESVGVFQFIQNIGPIFIILIIAGFFMLTYKKLRQSLLSYWLISLATAFIFLEYVYGFIALRLYKVHLDAFTASRFLTDMAYPLSFIAGYGIIWIAVKSRSRWRWAIFILAVIAFAYSANIIRKQCISPLAPSEKEALDWIKENTPQNALIVNNPYWMPYICWRQGTYTPLPVTEPLLERSVQERNCLLNAEPDIIIKWARKNRRPAYLYLYANRKENPPPQFTRVFKNAKIEIFALGDARGRFSLK